MKPIVRTLALVVTFICSVAGTLSAHQPAGCSPADCRSRSATRAEIGLPAPPFSLDAVFKQEFVTVNLGDYKGKWVVLFFYPGDFTFVCPTEIRGFNSSLAEFSKINTSVLAVSVDSKFSHQAWIKSGALGTLDFPLLSDFSKQTARDYGVLDEAKSSARRGLFIIDPNGVLQHILIHNDKVGRSVDEALRVLKALQTAELCPLNWKPGEKTLAK